MNKPFSERRLGLITDGGKLRKSGCLVSAVCEALEGAGGAIAFVQLREQVLAYTDFLPASDDELIELAKSLLPHCRKWGADLILNRRGDLAVKVGADGVHMGKERENIFEARSRWPELKTISFSAHSSKEAEKASEQGADYIILAPIFSPRSKPLDSRPILGTAALQSVSPLRENWLFALGGVSLENAKSCLEAGADGVAVLSAVLLADSPREEAKKFAHLLAAV